VKVLITLLLLTVDAVSSALALKATYSVRYQSGLFDNPLPADMWGPMAALTLFWWLLFAILGMYRTPITLSRFDEVFRTFKAVALGMIVVFTATFDLNDPVSWTRLFLLTYGGVLWVSLSIGRVLIRNYQRWLRQRGIGLWNAVIVGWNDVGRRLHTQLHQYPVWGFNVVGFVDQAQPAGEHHGASVIGTIEDLPGIIKSKRISWILVAPESKSPEEIIKVLDSCMSEHVRFMVVADFYHMVVGMVKTVEIHGLPLVEVVPQLISAWLMGTKRIADILVGLALSLSTLLLFPFIAIGMVLSGMKSLLYTQVFVGKHEKQIRLYRFRTSRLDDPERQGENMPLFGKFLRRTQLNDLPLAFNLFLGDLTIVGPEADTLTMWEKRRKVVPLYERRFRVRPGLTGWTQLRSKSGESPKDVYEKTGYDLYYIDHLSLSLDMKIIITTCWKVIKGDWN